MAMLNTVVNGLTRLNDIVSAAQAMAVRHVGYGAQPEHYAVVGAALLHTLAQGLGDAFDADTQEAWTAAYRTLSKVMIDAHEDAIKV